jgi:transketolase
LGDLRGKWTAFGWNAVEIDGHDVAEISAAIDEAKRSAARPTVILARTIKGKGVSFMEDRHQWHGQTVGDEDCRRALAELEGAPSHV